MNHYMKHFIFLISVFALSFNAQAQGYAIQFEINGLADTTIYLGNYFGESTYLKDTARVNSKGQFTFEGKSTLDEGAYFLVVNKTRLFDFLIGDNQTFSITSTMDAFYENIKVEGDLLNEIYAQDLNYNVERNSEAAPYVAVLQDSASNEEAKANARKVLDEINAKVMAHQDEIITQHPQLLLSRIFKANRKIAIPPTPEGEEEASFGYHYMKDHYWDDFDLGDPAMLRIGRPVYKEKVENYFDRLIVPDPDSIMKEINTLVKAAKKTDDTYKYFVWTLTLKYQNPSIMGLDKVFVELIDTYFESGEMDFWANAQLKKNLKDRADQLRLSLIGKTAPNMVMMDKDKNMKSMYAINNKYTILYFFDPDCGHCKKETPVLNEFYTTSKFDVEVFAISADTSMYKMEKYVKDYKLNWITVNGPRTSTGSYHKSYDAMTTPTLYVLDEKKKIIAKKIPSARLEDFLNQYERVQANRLKSE